MRDRAENQIILAMIRHGQTQANQQHRYLGRTDESLSERGKQMLLSYKEQYLYPEADCLFTSPMKRCVETAEILYPKLEPVVIPEWTETDFGRFEYKNYEELKDDTYYQRWIDSGGIMDFPGGESRDTFLERCKSGFQRMCRILQRIQTENTKQPVRAGMIVHGGTIMALLSSYGKREDQKGYFDYQTATGRGYLCRIDGWNKDAAFWNRKETGAETEIAIKEIMKI